MFIATVSDTLLVMFLSQSQFSELSSTHCPAILPSVYTASHNLCYGYRLSQLWQSVGIYPPHNFLCVGFCLLDEQKIILLLNKLVNTIRYDRREFNVDSKGECDQLNCSGMEYCNRVLKCCAECCSLK